MVHERGRNQQEKERRRSRSNREETGKEMEVTQLQLAVEEPTLTHRGAMPPPLPRKHAALRSFLLEKFYEVAEAGKKKREIKLE
jgi:hypothetical protein